MKKFIKKILVIGVPLFLLLIAVNYFGDAANLFSKSYAKELAAEISKGNNVTHVKNCDERDLQHYLISNTPTCPQIVVIGSSRVMEIRASFFKDSSLLNNGVSGASIEDLYAIVQLYEQKSCLPKKIIIGLDPWTLNKNNEQTRWRSLSTEYNLFAQRMGLASSDEGKGAKAWIRSIARSVRKYKELISPSYFQSSLQSLVSSDKHLQVTKSIDRNSFMRLSDASVTYATSYQKPSSAEMDKRISEYLTGNLYAISNFDRPDPEIEKKLELLVTYLRRQNTTVEFFLAPYHPLVYAHIISDNKYKSVIESEKYFVALAAKYNIKIWGSFNPAALQLQNTDFYDGMHCNDAAIQQILKKQ